MRALRSLLAPLLGSATLVAHLPPHPGFVSLQMQQLTRPAHGLARPGQDWPGLAWSSQALSSLTKPSVLERKKEKTKECVVSNVGAYFR
jgi:hypothetical protein